MTAKENFLRNTMPYAVAIERVYNLPAEFTLSLSALETGWGKAIPGNTYFNIKGPGQTFQTHEYVDGKRIRMRDSFRAYSSPLDSFVDFAELITGDPRYAAIVSAAPDVDAMIKELGRSKYATDPLHGSKIQSIKNNLPDFSATRGALLQTSDFLQSVDALRPSTPPLPRPRPNGVSGRDNTVPLPRARPDRGLVPRLRPDRASVKPQTHPPRQNDKTVLSAHDNPFFDRDPNLTRQSELIRQARTHPSKAGRIRSLIRAAGLSPAQHGL